MMLTVAIATMPGASAGDFPVFDFMTHLYRKIKDKAPEVAKDMSWVNAQCASGTFPQLCRARGVANQNVFNNMQESTATNPLAVLLEAWGYGKVTYTGQTSNVNSNGVYQGIGSGYPWANALGQYIDNLRSGFQNGLNAASSNSTVLKNYQSTTVNSGQ